MREDKNMDKDFATTPEWATKLLLENESFDGEILEPCCGTGAISEVLKVAGYTVKSSDIKNYEYGEAKDLFSITEQQENIITNPPFSQTSKVKRHLLSITKKKLALLWFVKNLGNEVETKDSKHLKAVYVLGKVNFPEIKFGWHFAWYVWDKEYKGDITIKKLQDKSNPSLFLGQ